MRDAQLTLWYRATLAHMASVQQWNAAHAERALTRFADAAELQFLVGCLHEQLAAPGTQAVLASPRLPPATRIRVGSSRPELAAASERLRRALELNPADAEARLHYGRVLSLSDRPQNAVTELKRALTGLDERALQYFAQLFLGSALEAMNEFDEARRAYLAAAALFPRAQAPLLSLGRLASALGDRSAASAALETLSSLPESDGDREDPWWDYLRVCGRGSPGRHVSIPSPQTGKNSRRRVASVTL